MSWSSLSSHLSLMWRCKKVVSILVIRDSPQDLLKNSTNTLFYEQFISFAVILDISKVTLNLALILPFIYLRLNDKAGMWWPNTGLHSMDQIRQTLTAWTKMVHIFQPFKNSWASVCWLLLESLVKYIKEVREKNWNSVLYTCQIFYIIISAGNPLKTSKLHVWKYLNC